MFKCLYVFMVNPIIKIQNLSVTYNLGRSNEANVLKNINSEIYPEEYIIFFGPSGCGKSTLLYTIAGLEVPTQGKVIANGKDLQSLSEKELINFHLFYTGMIFQAYHLIPSLTVEDNILLPQIFAKVYLFKRKAKAKDLMKRFGLFEFRKRKPSMLSGGQQQRVAIARALINESPILLADEPVGNLDSKNADIFLDLLEDLNKKDKKTIIHVTHNPRDLPRANRIFYMKDGQIIREVVNTEKVSLDKMSQEKISELERLAQAYPYLTESRLRSKLILNNLIFPFDIEAQQKIEETIDNYIVGKISKTKLFEKLDNPTEKGGANLYAQRAKNLTEKISKLAEKMKIVKTQQDSPSTPLKNKAVEIRTHLLDNYQGNISFEQAKRLNEFLSLRIIGKLKKDELEKLLDMPLKSGGMGLNRRTAKNFSRQIELILIK
ncbi:ABC transporter ATP-binding protein [Patescibacteria group bacterium]|nr:ABC transporter ATP-binding protein [Patescibacteria group bacterium]